MCVQVYNERVPRNKFEQFHEILVATDGRYLSKLRLQGDNIIVDYEPGDYVVHNKRWASVIQPIKEVRKDQAWRRLLRRVFKA